MKWYNLYAAELPNGENKAQIVFQRRKYLQFLITNQNPKQLYHSIMNMNYSNKPVLRHFCLIANNQSKTKSLSACVME